MIRVRSVLLFAIAVLTLGTGPLQLHAAGSAPSVNVRRVTAMNMNVFPGDFNGDGIPDLVGNEPWIDAPPSAIVALGKGDGTFGAPARIPCACRILAVADLNNDGRLDLVAEILPEPDVDIVALRGNGDGTFSSSGINQDWRVGEASAVSRAAVADVNGDGKSDVILVVDAGGPEVVQVVAGNGDMSFQWTTPTALAATAIPTGLATGDLNGDGRTDIAVANHDGKSVSLFFNQGALNFTSTEIPLDGQANGVLIADLNGDGKTDLAVAVTHDAADGLFYVDGFVYVLLGSGSGAFGAPAKYATDNGAFALVRADFNRDGIPDIATSNLAARKAEDFCGSYWDTVSILPGNRDGTFQAASTFSLGNQADPNDGRFRMTAAMLTAADLNRDGFSDLVTMWGGIVLDQPPDPNWAPKVTATATPPDANHTVTLRAAASDVDQDALSFAWTDSGGQAIEPTPAPCQFTPATGGVHTFTVTVDDHHGHTASSSVSVDFGSIGGGGGTPGTVMVTAPAQGEVVQGGTPYTVRWTASGDLSGVTHWALAFTTDGTGFTAISECSNVPASVRSCTWNNPNPPTPGAQIIVSNQSAANDISALSGVFAIAGPSGGVVGEGWAHADVGAVGAAGSASSNGFVRDGEAFTVSASGTDIWGTADEFHYVWKRVNGDFQIETRVDSLQAVNAWTKAGIMMRVNATDPASPQASIFVTPGNGTSFQRRLTQGAASSSTAGPALVAPAWLRMVRVGNAIRVYVQKQPTDPWTFVGEQVFTNLPSLVTVGLAFTSHADGTLATAKFSGTFLGAPSNLLFTHVIGNATGSASTDGTTFTVKASGSDIWGTSDNFVFLSTPIGGSNVQQITLRVRSLANTNVWAKAGVMIRETLDAGSRHADVIVSPGKGMALQVRSEPNGQSESLGQTAGSAPVWLRIRRTESTTAGQPASFTAWYSTDRTIWKVISTSAAFPMAHDAMIGIAVTSHAAGVETTAVIDDVRIER